MVWGDTLRQKAVDQWTRELPIKATRGLILDANGNVLAGNVSSFAVYVRPRSVTNAENVAETLSRIFGCDKQKLFEKIIKQQTSEITVARQVSQEKIAELKRHSLNGVYFSVDNTRVYPYKSTLCQTLGYTSTDGVGVTGLEAYYDKFLRGIDGEILYESNLIGADLKNSSPHYVSATNGFDVTLSVDVEVQLICEKAIERAMLVNQPKNCSVVVINPQNGEIVALATAPSFDLNAPPRNDVDALNKLSRNQVLCDSYEPGSTFKVVTALANINEHFDGNKKAFGLSYVFNSSNYRIVGGKKIKCWTTHTLGKHSNENLSLALNNSCNPCFVDIALSLGKSTMYKYIQNCNFGMVTGVDFYGEAMGMVLAESAVTDGDLARISFGQTIAVTPIQLACAVGACVNGGNYYSPKFVSKISDNASGVTTEIQPKFVKRVASEKSSKILAEYLEQVVEVGSGKNAYIEGYRVGGKTGVFGLTCVIIAMKKRGIMA